MIIPKKIRYDLIILVVLLVTAMSAHAQRVRGELRIEVRDGQGTALSPGTELVSNANQLRLTFVVGADGRYVVQDLPFGVYRLTLNAKGFAAWTSMVEIRSEVPVRLLVTLGLAPAGVPLLPPPPVLLLLPQAIWKIRPVNSMQISTASVSFPFLLSRSEPRPTCVATNPISGRQIA